MNSVFLAICCSLTIVEGIDFFSLPNDWRDYIDPSTLARPVSQKLSPKLFEGDIKGFTLRLNGATTFNAIANKKARWPGGVVPFEFGPGYTTANQDVLLKAMKDIESKTCIRYVKRGTQPDYIIIGPGDGCSSYVGKVGGSQEVTLDIDGCLEHGIIIHELLHALGFHHEQSRSDRSSSVFINLDNVATENIPNFQFENTDNLGTNYDYGSVMHYGPFYFAKDPSKPTIIPKVKGVRIGQRDGLSPIDILKINKFYECGANGAGSTTPKSKPDAPQQIPPYIGCMSWWPIRTGQSCKRVAKICSISPEQLVELNGHLLPDSQQCGRLRVGEKLCCSIASFSKDQRAQKIPAQVIVDENTLLGPDEDETDRRVTTRKMNFRTFPAFG